MSEPLGIISERLGAGDREVVGVIFGRWEEMVGAALAAHVRPLRLHERVLVVVVDHPAWATQVRHLASQILARLEEVCPSDGGPERLEVRVRA